MADFVALYRGLTVSEPELVTVSAEPQLVARFFSELVGEDADAEKCPQTNRRDAVPALALAKRDDSYN